MKRIAVPGWPVTIRSSRPDDGDRAVEIWRSAVDATHDFLTREHRREIDVLARGFLPSTPMWLAVGAEDVALGFMILTDARMEALFIHSAHRGTGIGRTLLEHAFVSSSLITSEVNEQNWQAVGFYRRMGFVQIGRSEVDEDGRPYPLIRLRYDAKA